MRWFMHYSVHVVLTAMMALLALTFLDNTDTLHGNIVYSFMLRIMNERQWGFTCLGFAAFGMFATPSPNWPIRVAAAASLAFAHGGLALCLYLGNPHAPASFIFGGYAALGTALAFSTAFNSQALAGRDGEGPRRGGDDLAHADPPRSLAG